MIGLTPDITAVTVVSHGVLRMTFSDGLSVELDVLDRMRGPVFAEARTPGGFERVAVDSETGTVVWPGGADLAPDTLCTCEPRRAPGRIKTWPRRRRPGRRALQAAQSTALLAAARMLVAERTRGSQLCCWIGPEATASRPDEGWTTPGDCRCNNSWVGLWKLSENCRIVA